MKVLDPSTIYADSRKRTKMNQKSSWFEELRFKSYEINKMRQTSYIKSFPNRRRKTYQPDANKTTNSGFIHSLEASYSSTNFAGLAASTGSKIGFRRQLNKVELNADLVTELH